MIPKLKNTQRQLQEANLSHFKCLVEQRGVLERPPHFNDMLWYQSVVLFKVALELSEDSNVRIFSRFSGRNGIDDWEILLRHASVQVRELEHVAEECPVLVQFGCSMTRTVSVKHVFEERNSIWNEVIALQPKIPMREKW